MTIISLAIINCTVVELLLQVFALVYVSYVSGERLAAAGRLRSAVALELAAGKVWALPIAVQICSCQ